MPSSDDLWKSLRGSESSQSVGDDARQAQPPEPAELAATPEPLAIDPASVELPRPSRTPLPAPVAAVPKASIAKWAAIGVLGLLIIALGAWAILSTRSTKPAPRIADTSPGKVPGTASDAQAAGSASTTQGTPPTVATAPPVARRGSLLNLNTATAAQLQALPGIGPAMAKRLIDQRTKLGGLRSWDDVDAVEGIGPATLEKLKAAATIE